MDTLVKILPTGVESKKDIGALNTESMRAVKKLLDAFSPRSAAIKVLTCAQMQLRTEITA